MNRNFEIGDLVAWIDEDLEGRVTAFKKAIVIVETNDGFEMEATITELVLLPKQDVLKVDWKELQGIKQNELRKSTFSSPTKKDKKKKQPALEVDLHIHELVNNTRNMSNFEMLNIQLDAAMRQINFAKQKRIKRVVLIHGIGQGVLKAELETLLRRDEEVDFYDADYKTYGLGATEVYIYENA